MALRARVCAMVLGAAALSIGLVQPARASEPRHFEKVSPADKGQGDIIGDGETNVASTSGDAVSLSARTPFGDTIGSGVSGQTQYIVRRTPNGWTAHAITPQPRADAYQTFFGATRFQAYSDDLRTGVVWGYDFPAVTGDVPLRNNIYVEDLASRALRPVTMFQNGLPSPLPHPIAELGSDADWGISADAKHVAFVSHVPYLPNAATDGSVFGPPNVYQWDDGVLSLAGILPDGRVPPGGSDVVTQEVTSVFPFYRQTMSADGSRLLFTAVPTGGTNNQLFQRIDGARTVEISQSGLDLDPRNVRLSAATPDGRNVFFITDSPLTGDDSGSATDLYRWTDGANPPLTKITTGNGFVGQVIGVSDDGQRVYYQTTDNEIYLWDHGTTSLVIRDVTIPGSGLENVRLGADDWGPGYGRVSPDGRYLAFGTISSSGVPGNDVGPTGEITNGHREMYLYAIGSRTKCISCPSGPAMTDATVAPTVTSGVITYTLPGIRPRFLSDNGRVFFSTAEALVPQDVNGVGDVYEYDPATGKVGLVSTGTGSDAAGFVDASTSGNDVFFVTRQRLTHSDQDNLVDLFDARIGDALPDPIEQPATSCEGESCQPPPSGGPAENLLGSLAFDESGTRGLKPVRLAVRKSIVFHNASGLLRVRLSASGTLGWDGKGLRSGSTRRSKAGTVVLHLRLDRRGRAHLRTSGLYRTSVHLTLSTSRGVVRRTTHVAFKVAAAKKGR